MFNVGNKIDPDAEINVELVMGNYNVIGPYCRITGFKGKKGKLILGDCNVLNEDIRIMCPEAVFGDWNVVHNKTLILGEGPFRMGHNCWVGQETILDTTGGLYLRNGVRIGMRSQIWTHIASGEQVEGYPNLKRETIINDNVWLVGSCTVGSGLTLGNDSIFLIGSVVTHSSSPFSVNAGVPAQRISMHFKKEVTPLEKIEMMWGWAQEYSHLKGINPKRIGDIIILEDHGDRVVIGFEDVGSTKDTFFNLADKTYTKHLSGLERDFYAYLFGNKARFIPAVEK